VKSNYWSAIFLLILLIIFTISAQTDNYPSLPQNLFEYSGNMEPRWVSFENINAEQGQGGKENNGAKGHPCEYLKSKGSLTLMDFQGTGIINRMWITINDRSPQMLRALKIEIFWDNETNPAVSAPFGDFFGISLGKTTTFNNSLFANPEGRSFICFIEMPFKKAAKVIITNESEKDLDMLFYDIDFQKLKSWNNNFMYFHCYWHRDTATILAEDFEILPKVTGKGRFLGTNIGLKCNEAYKNFWWGEGEVKVFLNGDIQYPTLVGTGSEDYIGSGWGQGKFYLPYSGCLIADNVADEWAFYRFHIPDPIYFKTDCRVTIQQIGGGPKQNVINLMKKGVKLIPTTIHKIPVLHHYYQKGTIIDLEDPKLPDAFTNFYRSDDLSCAAYFYLSEPSNNLPHIQNLAIRLYKLEHEKKSR
jgi:hypothetical protein